MFKKISSLVVLFSIVFSFSFNVFANNMNIDLILLELQQLENKYDINLFLLDEFDETELISNFLFLEEIDINDIEIELKFESVEEFEEFLKLLLNNQNTMDEIIISIDDLITPFNNQQRTQMTRATWWEPSLQKGLTSFTHWKNIDYTYRFTFINNQFNLLSIPTIHDSWTTGFNWGFWNHRSGSGTVTSRNTARITSRGTYWLGIEIAGFPIGFSWNEDWSVNVRFQ